MSETAETPWVTDTRNRLLLDKVTIGDNEYTVDRKDIFVALGDAHPELRESIVAMFDRAGDSLAGMRYPANLDRLPVDDKTLDFLRNLIDMLPVENEVQQRAVDRAVAIITEHHDPKALALHRLVKKTSESM